MPWEIAFIWWYDCQSTKSTHTLFTCHTPTMALAMRMRRMTNGSTKAVIVPSPSSNQARVYKIENKTDRKVKICVHCGSRLLTLISFLCVHNRVKLIYQFTKYTVHTNSICCRNDCDYLYMWVCMCLHVVVHTVVFPYKRDACSQQQDANQQILKLFQDQLPKWLPCTGTPKNTISSRRNK